MKADSRTSLLTQAGALVGIKVRSHTELVDDALDAFTKAEQKMESAIATIEDQISAEDRAITEARNRKEAAIGSKEKLSRVLDRVRALTA